MQQDLFGADDARARLERERRAAARMEAENRKRERAEGQRRAQEGMDRAEAKADRVAPGWGGRAFDMVGRFIDAHPNAEFTGEAVKRWAYAHGLDRPENESAWGPVMVKAKRQKLIAFVGFAPPTAASRHGSPNRRWRRA